MDHELQLNYEATIQGWMRALALKDRETEGHSLRLANLSLMLAKDLDLGDGDMVNLRRGALLHDIGKMGIPDAILIKPAALSEAEWELIKQHPVYGYEILAPIPFLRSAAEIAYCHHENWDGSGYPRKLKAKEIPLLARIVSICNVWDALLSDQPYRYAWDRKEALKYIQGSAGKQFDPELVPAFLQVIQEKI